MFYFYPIFQLDNEITPLLRPVFSHSTVDLLSSFYCIFKKKLTFTDGTASSRHVLGFETSFHAHLCLAFLLTVHTMTCNTVTFSPSLPTFVHFKLCRSASCNGRKTNIALLTQPMLFLKTSVWLYHPTLPHTSRGKA